MRHFLGQLAVQEWLVSCQTADLKFNIFMLSYESRSNPEQQPSLTLWISGHTAKPALKVAKQTA